MPTYDSIIGRFDDAAALIPVQEIAEVIKVAGEESLALSLFRRVDMGVRVATMPVLSALPAVYFVSNDIGLKQTTEQAWESVTLTAEEIACLVPVPDNVLSDASIDIWGEVRPELARAFGRKLDAAVFAGTEKPSSWSQAIVPAALGAGNAEAGGATVAQGGIAEDLNALLSLVEADGYDPSALALTRPLRATLRSARDTSGQKLADVSDGSYEGVPVRWATPGVLGTAKAIAGDFSMAIVGIRQDVSFTLSNSAVVIDDTGKVLLSAFQQDTTILRAVFRVAFATATPVTERDPGAAGTPYPFAILDPGGTTMSAQASESESEPEPELQPRQASRKRT
jgi:HK97 family phage major capsid protein